MVAYIIYSVYFQETNLYRHYRVLKKSAFFFLI